MIDYLSNIIVSYMPMWRSYLVYIVGFALVVFVFDFTFYLIDQKYKRW